MSGIWKQWAKELACPTVLWDEFAFSSEFYNTSFTMREEISVLKTPHDYPNNTLYILINIIFIFKTFWKRLIKKDFFLY